MNACAQRSFICGRGRKSKQDREANGKLFMSLCLAVVCVCVASESGTEEARGIAAELRFPFVHQESVTSIFQVLRQPSPHSSSYDLRITM